MQRDSNWHHIVCTYDAGVRYIYLDGVSVANDSAAPTQMISTLGNNFLIGKHQQPTSMAGQINEVSIFDYALSSSQVTTLWGGGTSVSNPMALPSPPVAYYPLGTSAWNGNYLAENNAIGDYVFDFDSDYIKVNQGSGINISGNLTLSVWVYIEDDTWNPVISKSTDVNNRNYEFAIRPTTRNISFYTNNGSLQA